jgi:putative glycosyltransferase
MKISVVTSLYKSGPYVEELHRRAVLAIGETGAAEYEIIFVNDGSPDDGLAIARGIAARDPNVIVIDLARNFGQHRATITGLGHATGDYMFILDSDLEEEPEWIARFYRELIARNCDVVFGVSHHAKGGAVYTLLRKTFYKTLNLLSSAQFAENACSARLMTRRYVEALLQFREREFFMAGVWHMTGFTQLPVEVVKHDSSPTTYTLSKLASAFINAVTAFSTRPLVAISVAGIALSATAFGYLGFILYRKLAYGVTIEGWTSVMAAILLIGGITLFFNGVMAIYIAKIFLEVKQRPLTIVKEVFGGQGGGARRDGSSPGRQGAHPGPVAVDAKHSNSVHTR